MGEMGGMGMQDTYSCSRCDKEVSKAATSCPHCGAHFEYTENSDGTRSYNGSGSSSFRIPRGAIKLGVAVVIFVISGAVAVAKKLMGGSSDE